DVSDSIHCAPVDGCVVDEKDLIHAHIRCTHCVATLHHSQKSKKQIFACSSVNSCQRTTNVKIVNITNIHLELGTSVDLHFSVKLKCNCTCIHSYLNF